MKDITYEGPAAEDGGNLDAPLTPARSRGSKEAPTLRTFHTDLADLIGKGQTTKTEVVLAEVARREKQKNPQAEERERPTHLGRIIFLLFLLLAFGVGVGIYALIGSVPIPFLSQKSQKNGEERHAVEGTTITIDHSSREGLLVAIRDVFGKTTLSKGDFRVVTFITHDERGKENVMTTREVFSLLKKRVPAEDFVRSLDASPTYGIYSGGNLVGYLKLRSYSYPETFAGMLAWESRMAEDLIPVLLPEGKQSDVVALRGRIFKDELVAGVSARVLSDPGGTSFLAYAFPDQRTLLITGGRDTLRMLIETMRSEIKK